MEKVSFTKIVLLMGMFPILINAMALLPKSFSKTMPINSKLPQEGSCSESKSQNNIGYSNVCNYTGLSRRHLFQISVLSPLFLRVTPEKAIAIPDQKSYSSNARNFDRLAKGDSSAGSVYNNSPSSASGAKRRAMVGCKVESTRQQVVKLEGLKSLSEKDCNLRVMGGDSEFMLNAIRELECPTCPYGIKGA